ncbi:hypothetical protein B0H67DRAFT_481351 [Lasiosphaeris hirsuta]|uniref:HD domain-containing protein n=1 Tax=Lasiosphaeris hirsuta TaxID=260670 RepID=A0AA40E2P0_9PEZI|nr:hypothetical protein B0H67DRAFT_481351 [Lasiosphaeris hirsuta]
MVGLTYLLNLLLPALTLAHDHALTNNDDPLDPLSFRSAPVPSPPLPRRTLAGVSVVDTPLVRAAQAYARAHGADFVYAHIMRSWLFGALIASHDAGLRSAVDEEVLAVAALLHDLGWDRAPGSEIVSAERRFEVDGAVAARRFIRGREEDGQAWEERRVQLVWDAIALHTERSIAFYKELEVQVVSKGIEMDFFGPGLGVTEAEYTAIVAEFPKTGFKNGFNDTIVWLCQSKPDSTINTWMQPWGERYVEGYEVEGKAPIDFLLSGL